MTEREELELAARVMSDTHEEFQQLFYYGWNPRGFKDDAMGLAEALGMEIYFSHKFVLLSGNVFKWGENEECKTVCEAITRAAALYQKAREVK